MKILNIMLGSGKGGLEQVFADYINAQLRLGHTVAAICMHNCCYIDQIPENVSCHYLQSKSVLNPFTHLKIKKIIEKENPDLIILSGNRTVKLTVSSYLSSILKITPPVISVIHNNHSYTDDVDYAIAVSKDIQEITRQAGVQNVFCLPNTTQGRSFKENLFSRRPIVIGALGRLHKNKGYDILFNSLALLKKEGIDFKIIVAGDGPEKDSLLEQVKRLSLTDHIDFIGWVDDKDQFFDRIDIFCLPSRVEPFGIVLLEAMTRNKAIIATDCQGPMDIFSHQHDALIVPRDNEVQLFENLKMLLESPQLCEKLAKNSFDKFQEQYGPTVFEKKLDSILAEVVKQGTLN